MNTIKKLYFLLTTIQRRSAVVLLCLMFVGMLLETLGIGLIIPALALMAQGDLAAKYPVLVPWLDRLGNPSHQQLIVAGMLILVGVYAIKALFIAFNTWRQASFVCELAACLSQRLFAGYLHQPYTFHLQRNSAQLIHSTLSQVGGVSSIVRNGQMLISEILVVFGISVMLLMVEPLGALLVVSVLGLAGWGFHYFTRGYILRWGEELQVHEGLRIQHLQEGLGGAKDVKLLGREYNFIDQYQTHNIGSARINKLSTTMMALPRLWLELLAVVGLAMLVIVMIGEGKGFESILPTLGLFAAAAFRLMPSVNRILSSVQGMRFAKPVLETIYSEFKLLAGTKRPTHSQPVSFETVLSLDSISYRYPSSEIYALLDVSLSIPRGSSAGIIGVSGSGKSTLVDLILGLLTPSSGTVSIDAIDIQTNLRGWQDKIGYVPQSIFLTDDTVRRNVAFGLPAEEIDENAILQSIKAAQLDQFINELPNGLDTVIGERGVRLSGGQRQRIGIARALYHDPPVLVLDEATSSLDTATEQGVMDAVRALKGDKTLIIVAHRLSTVEQCDRLYRLEQGMLVDEGESSVLLGKVAGPTGS